MRTRRQLAGSLAALLLAAVAGPVWAVEIVLVPAGPVHAPAPVALHAEPPLAAASAPGCEGGWGRCLHWLRSFSLPKFCPVCNKIERDCCRPGCDPTHLPNAGFHPTRWRHLPPEPTMVFHHPEAADPAPPAAEKLPPPSVENNKTPPGKKKEENKDPESEKLPSPKKSPPPDNNTGARHAPLPLPPISAAKVSMRAESASSYGRPVLGQYPSPKR
jgi:hypothetical protein